MYKQLIRKMDATSFKSETYIIEEEPFYYPVRDEIEVFESAYKNQLPVLLKGPTGCGKTRFMEHMSWRLKRPLITVSCHDDLTASDLVGRYLIQGTDTVWIDGPLARAVRVGAICYLDEIVEARKDTTVVIQSLENLDSAVGNLSFGTTFPASVVDLTTAVNNVRADLSLLDSDNTSLEGRLGTLTNLDSAFIGTERTSMVNALNALRADIALIFDENGTQLN